MTGSREGSGTVRASLLQPISAGLLAGIVGYASTFALVVQALAAVGASRAEAASGLLALMLVKAALAVWLCLRTRMPISVAWSTPGAALLVTTGVPAGGFPAAVGAFLLAAALVVAAGLWRPFGRAVAAIPATVASAMLAGILFGLCTAPVRAVAALPALALPIVIVWAVALRIARPWAVPLAVLATALTVAFATPSAPMSGVDFMPRLNFVAPVFTLDAAVGITLPLFVVTMASQNVPGLAVLRANGFDPPIGLLFVATGLGSALIAVGGGHMVNLAAITAALCAGPEAHPDPARRYWAGIAAGATYAVFGLGAGAAAVFVAASPPLLIEAVAGLALLGSLAAALTTALAREDERLPGIVTFVVAASGTSFFGIGAAFWALVVGCALLFALRPR